MTRFHFVVIRAILSVFFAVIITRFFRGEIDPYYVAGLAIILFALAYFSEYLRHRRKPK